MAVRRTKEPRPPTGLTRVLFRLPIVFYRLGLGWLLGRHHLLLEHTGRKSGLRRRAVLDVFRHDPATNTYIVASGWGERADWLRNVQQTPEVEIRVGRAHRRAIAVRLSKDEAAREYLEFARRSPRVARFGVKLLGYTVDGIEDFAELGAMMPMIAFRCEARP